MTEKTHTMDRTALKARLDGVREEIEQACQRAGRKSDELSLLAVTKTFPLEVVEAARELGLTRFGENRAQELSEKATAMPGRYLEGTEIEWHMVGHLQRNKAKDIVEHSDFFQALDSPRLARELNKRARREGRVMPCFVQVNITEQDRKYGIMPEKTHAYLDSLAQYEHLKITGLMAMAAHVEDPEEVRPQFRRMRTLFETYDDRENPRVRLEELSMGMSNDFPVAIEEGATHLRLGSALFGPRDY